MRANLQSKITLFIFLLIGAATSSFAQKSIASPRDSVKGQLGDATIRVNYGSPSVKGRPIWGKLVPYGQVWRAGANEATLFATDKKITIQGKELPAGQYSFFAIPQQDKWTIIFNKIPKQWGAFEYSDKEDALRVEVKPKKTSENYEQLKYKITGNNLVLAWEKLEVPLEIRAAK